MDDKKELNEKEQEQVNGGDITMICFNTSDPPICCVMCDFYPICENPKKPNVSWDS